MYMISSHPYFSFISCLLQQIFFTPCRSKRSYPSWRPTFFTTVPKTAQNTFSVDPLPHRKIDHSIFRQATLFARFFCCFKYILHVRWSSRNCSSFACNSHIPYEFFFAWFVWSLSEKILLQSVIQIRRSGDTPVWISKLNYYTIISKLGQILDPYC